MNGTLKILLTGTMLAALPVFGAAADVHDNTASIRYDEATSVDQGKSEEKIIAMHRDIGLSSQATPAQRLKAAHFFLALAQKVDSVSVIQAVHKESMLDKAMEIFHSIDNDPSVALFDRIEANIYLEELERKKDVIAIYLSIGNDVTNTDKIRLNAARALKALGFEGDAAAIRAELPLNVE